LKSQRLKALSNRPVYLIADLHLEVGTPATTQLLLDFLTGPVREAEALYILGDLFEVWIGDDAPSETARQVSRALKELSNQDIAIYFLCGNRDFLLGEKFCAESGMQRLEEPVRLEYRGPATALIHGDTLCTDDTDYQQFRAKVRDPEWQRRTLSRPLWWRRILARFARSISQRRNRSKSAEIMDVNADAVAEAFRMVQIDRLIHGHTHRPAIHRLEVDGRAVNRIVLGDWHETHGSAVRVSPNGQLELLRLTYNPEQALQLEPVDRLPPNPET
jgi:UDP-2,3-diacylglucosamine hydrolase